MLEVKRFILFLSLIIVLSGCTSIINRKEKIIRINSLELQLIDAETEKPIPNINVRYYLKIERPVKGFIYTTEYFLLSLKEENILSNNNGIILFKENEYKVRQIDSIKLYIHINIKIDNDGIILETTNKYGMKPDKNDRYEDFGASYFIMNYYRNHVTFINENYYPAYILLFYLEGKNSYIITQVNNTGEKIDFKSEDINNVIYGLNTEKLIIKLYKTK